jgi:hypothetical protein
MRCNGKMQPSLLLGDANMTVIHPSHGGGGSAMIESETMNDERDGVCVVYCEGGLLGRASGCV